MQKLKGGRWRYKLTVSLKLAKSTIQRYKSSRVDVGVTNLQCPGSLQRPPYKDTHIQRWNLAVQTCSALVICKAYHTQMHKFKGGRWRCKLTVCLKFATSTIQRYRNARVDIGVTNLQCRLKFAKYTIQKHRQIQQSKGGRCNVTVCC